MDVSAPSLRPTPGGERYLDQQLHQLPAGGSSGPLPRTADNDAEEAAHEAQVTAGAGVQLLRVPPHVTCRSGLALGCPCSQLNPLLPLPRKCFCVFTFAGGVATPEGRDEVSEQAEQDGAVACVAVAEERGQAVGEGGSDGGLEVPLLDAHNTRVSTVRCSVKAEIKNSFGGFPWAYQLAVVPDHLQEAGLQQRVDPLTGPQVLRLVRVAQAEQQSPRQHQEGPSGGHARALQSLHRQRQLLQLRGNKAQLNVSSDGSNWGRRDRWGDSQRREHSQRPVWRAAACRPGSRSASR